MTVKEYRKALKKQLKKLENFKPKTIMSFSDNRVRYVWDLPDIDFTKMRYEETNGKMTYRAIDESHRFVIGISGKPIESNSISNLADMISYYCPQRSFELRVKRRKGDWSKPTEYERKTFENELAAAFRLDEMH